MLKSFPYVRLQGFIDTMKNIYLVGFMGTGKTGTAKILAERFGLTFVDMDDLIESSQGMAIADIFKLRGEPYFRKAEKEVIVDLAAREGLVVACGGGAFVDPENIGAMKSSGAVVCLTSSPEIILKRTSGFTHRPLINVDNPLEKIKELLSKRAPFYAQAHCTIDCDQLSLEETAEEVARCLSLE